MKIEQFENKYLSHYSYAVLSERQIVLIDPSRNPEQYYEFAENHNAEIIGVIETHPHADFVSSHLEIHKQCGAKIYGSKLIGASYPIVGFDEGDELIFGKVTLKTLNTPGHSPDSISIVLKHEGKNKAVFTGDTLFIGDCGRPDLRESGGDQNALRHVLAKNMFFSLRNKLMKLEDDVVVYPAHGAGTLCGKALSDANSSTIGAEKIANWSLQEMSEENFINELTSDLPFIPAYFPFNVSINKKGAANFEESVQKVSLNADAEYRTLHIMDKDLWIIDLRNDQLYKNNHLPHSINLMEGDKFETWLGSIIKPGEKFYLGGSSTDQLNRIIKRIADIGYEDQIEEAFIAIHGPQQSEGLNMADFKANQGDYTIIDVRNDSEVKKRKIFPGSISIPLAELRERIGEIPNDKPIAVHCAGGYRSAAASSLISSEWDEQVPVYDIGDAIKDF